MKVSDVLTSNTVQNMHGTASASYIPSRISLLFPLSSQCRITGVVNVTQILCFITVLLNSAASPSAEFPQLTVRAIEMEDCEAALAHTKPSAHHMMKKYEEFQREFESV